MAEKDASPELLFCIVKNHHQVEEILTGFLDLGVRGATVFDGRGMGQILSTDVPIFAGFRSLFPGGSAGTYLILSVVEEGVIDEVIDLIEEVCGDLGRPGTGVLFTVPVRRIRGLAPQIS